MKAVVTVVGKDTVGILSKISTVCAENQMNVVEVSQSILQDMFCMIMLVETKGENANFALFSDTIKKEGENSVLLSIQCMLMFLTQCTIFKKD